MIERHKSYGQPSRRERRGDARCHHRRRWIGRQSRGRLYSIRGACSPACGATTRPSRASPDCSSGILSRGGGRSRPRSRMPSPRPGSRPSAMRADLHRHAHPVRPGRRAPRPARAWCARARRPGSPYIAGSRRRRSGADELYTTTGHWSAPIFGLPKLLWYVRERAALWTRTRWVLQLCDWLLERLCGVVASEHSSASMSQLLDVSTSAVGGRGARGRWHRPGADAAAVDAGAVAGGLASDVAAARRPAGGTPVHVGGGDTHVACLGAGAVDGRA